MKISQLRDQPQEINVVTPKEKLVTKTVFDFQESWDSFLIGIRARKESPKFYELWTACSKEESWLISRGIIQKFEEGDSQAYATHINKGGGIKTFSFQRINEAGRNK